MTFGEIKAGQHFTMPDESPRRHVKAYWYGGRQTTVAVCIDTGHLLDCESISDDMEVELVGEPARLRRLRAVERAEADHG